jgi:hypothetical protein
MSSVPILIEPWRRRDRRLEQALSTFLSAKGLDLLVVLLYGQGDGFSRQLALCSADEGLLDLVVAKMSGSLGLTEIPAEIPVQTHGEPELMQAGVSGVRRAEIRCFAQRENSESRKVIEPRLREILENL